MSAYTAALMSDMCCNKLIYSSKDNFSTSLKTYYFECKAVERKTEMNRRATIQHPFVKTLLRHIGWGELVRIFKHFGKSLLLPLLQGYKTEKTQTQIYSWSPEYLHQTQHTVTHNNRQHAGPLTQYSGKHDRMDTRPRYNEAVTSHTRSEVLVLLYTVCSRFCGYWTSVSTFYQRDRELIENTQFYLTWKQLL